MAGAESFAGQSKAQIAGAGALQAKTGPGRVVSIICHAANTGGITLYDNTATSGTPVWSKAAMARGEVVVLDCPMDIGVRVVLTTDGTVTVVYS